MPTRILQVASILKPAKFDWAYCISVSKIILCIFRYYVRAATLVQYFFYKNVAGFTPQLLMAIFNNFSTQSIYDSINLTLFNIIFTSLPIFCYGMLEQNLSAVSLMNNPALVSCIRVLSARGPL